MSKRKRTAKEILAMKAKAVRFQENLRNYEAAIRIESLTVEEYAARRNLEIVAEPVRKRRRRPPNEPSLAPGYARRTQVTEWASVTDEGHRKTHREVRTEIWKKE